MEANQCNGFRLVRLDEVIKRVSRDREEFECLCLRKFQKHKVKKIKRALVSGSVGWRVIPYKKTGVGLISDQGTRLGCRLDPQSGCIGEATNPCFSLTSMFLSLSLSLSPAFLSLSL